MKKRPRVPRIPIPKKKVKPSGKRFKTCGNPDTVTDFVNFLSREERKKLPKFYRNALGEIFWAR